VFTKECHIELHWWWVYEYNSNRLMEAV